MADPNATHTAHAQRVRELDPLLDVDPPDGDGPLLHAEAGPAVAVGRAVFAEVAPDADAALWGALRTWSLSVSVDGGESRDRDAAVSLLLDRWDAHLAGAATRGDLDSAAIVRWPSRDLDGPRSLVLHGFAPLKTIAVRPAGRPLPTAATAAVRAAEPGDAAALGDLAWRLLWADVPWGMVTHRPGARELLARAAADDLADPGAVVLVAEVDGEVVGHVRAQSVTASRWISGVVAADPIAYVPSLYVEPGRRGAGIGAALVAELARRLDAAGIAASLLHHATPSPVSAPFWARLGYRPLWTMWQRRPVRRQGA